MSKEIILSEEEYKDLERKHTEQVMGMGPEFYRQRKLGDYEEEPTQQTSYGKRYTNRDANQIAQQKIADKESAKISPITLRDMTKDLDTFRKFDKEGAFESDLSVAEMLWNGSKAMVVDSYDWIESLPQRVMSNFGIQTIPSTNIPLLIPPSGMTTKQKAQYDKNKKRIQAKGQATTLQTLGNISLNYELMGEGLSLLKDKMINKITGKSGSVEEDAERYRFWKSLADIEERRQTVYAELATNDFLMMGGDPEIREMIKNGEVQPDYGSAMGGSMWADPLNYVPLTAGFRVAKGGTSFTGMERALLNDARDSIILRAGMEQLDKVKPSPELTQSMKAVDGFIRENLDKLDKIAKNRPVALEDFANKLPLGHPLRDKIKQALNGVNTTGKVSKTGWAVGGAGVVAGKSVEGLGALFEFASRLLPETGINVLMKMGLSEEVAVSLLKNNKLTRLAGMAGGSGLVYGGLNLLTDDEMVATLLTAGFVLPQLAKTYGRDIATMSRELMSPETTLPYWKRMSMRGAEDISSRTIDRSSWSPIKSLAEDVVGASSGKVKERLFDASGQLQSMKKGGLYGIANALDKSKAGRYLETGGRMAKGGLAGGTMGGIFGYVAGGGEQDEAGWGGVGAGFTLGAMGALAGNYGRFRGARSSAEIIQMRHGDLQYYKNKLLPESQKETFNKMPKEHQIAYASASMSRPATEFRFLNLGKDEVGGKQYIEADGTAVVEVNVDSEWSLQPLLHHEITHYIEEVGGKAAFDNMLIGNPLMETSGMFTKLDKDGKPIKKFDENGNLDGYEVSDAFNELKFKYFIKFGKYKEVYDKSVKMSLAHGTSNKNAHEFAYRRVIQKIDQMEVMRDKDGNKIADADTKTAREIVAEHGVDFLLNDPRRYRDLHEGWVGAFLRNVVDSPLLNNAGTLRGMLAKLGATFRENGLLASDNNLFGSMQRIEPITNLLRKYNRQMEGLSKDQMDKKFPLEESESTIADVQMTGQDFARHPELIDHLRAGTFLQVDSNGNIIPNAPMSPKEIKAYNTRFTEAIKEATEQLENEEGLPEGHIRSQTTKTNETRFEGRYISDKVLDMVAKKGGWNKAQIDTLRSINSALRDYANEKGGTDWLFTYFKASKKGKYVSAKVQNKIDIPYGIEITKDGNINIRVIDLKLFHRNIERAFKNYQAEIKRLYGNDLVQAESLFLNDLHKYHMNHAEGKQGMTGLDQNPQIAESKANFINALFGKSSKAHAEANPWLAQISGNKRKAPSPTYQSRRIERIGKVQQLSGKQHVDINKILTAFMPEKPVDIDALLKQNPQNELNTRSGVNQIPAYHGSPYNFNKFSTDRIGTGEGAQAFGYGLYFAGSKDVAKFYRDKLSRSYKPRYEYTPEVKQKYEPLIEAENLKREEVNREIQSLLNDQYNVQSEASFVAQKLLVNEERLIKNPNSSILKETKQSLFKEKKDLEKQYADINKAIKPLYNKRGSIENKISDLVNEMQSKGTLVKDEGKMYEVDLKPKEEEFLLWDKPMSEQSDIVKGVHNQILKGKTETIFTTPMNTFGTSVMNSKKTFRDQQMSDPDDGASFYQLLSRAMKGDDRASRALKFEGIKGIKYLDGSSRRKGEGEYNYVIFDDADVEITAKYMPKFEGASDNVPKIIEDINIATNIFQNAPALYPFERSWHINTLVKRVISNADTSLIGKRIENAKKHNNSKRLEFNQSRLNKADEYFYYMKYPLQDLVASLPDIKSQDLKLGLNSARNADPFEPIKDNFQGGSKRPLQDILQEMANVHDKFYPESKSTLNEIRGIGEILKDDYGAEIKEEFLDELYRRYRNLTKEEHEQFKAEEQKTLNELFNPEFNDIQDLGGGTKFIKPIDPDKNLMPSAERKPVTFSARPEEIITLDSENIKNFMPAHKNVRLEDYLDYPIFALASDRVGVGTMLVGTNDYKIPVDFDAQGGRGFMYLYEDGGWAFKESGTAQTFLSRVAEVAGDRDEVLVGITVLSEINHLNSVFGQLSLAQAYEAALRSGHISKDQMKDHLQSVMTKVAIQKYGKDVFYTKDDPKKGIKKGDIKHKEGEYKISKKYRDMLLSIDSVDEYKNQILKKQFPFSVHSEIVKRNNLAETAKDKAKGVTLPIKGKQAKELGLEMQSIANDIIDPQLRGLPVGQVVALLKVPVNQKPKKVDFHLSYPWQIKGEAIGFLDQFKALKDLTSNKKVFDQYGNVGGQPLQTVMPVFDKLNPTLYMPNYKPMLDAKLDNIRGLVMPKIKQDKFSPQQFKAKLSEVKGAKEMAEDLGLLDYVEGKKSVTKDEIDQYISDNRKSIMLKMQNGNGMYDGSQMESGMRGGYNEILYELPESARYPFPDVSGGHWKSDRILMHMRTTKRLLDDGSDVGDGPETFHIEEMQSDWHQYGRGQGYADLAKIREVYEAELGLKKLSKDKKNAQNQTYSKLQPELEAFAKKREKELKELAEFDYSLEPIVKELKEKNYRNLSNIDMRFNGGYALINSQLRDARHGKRDADNSGVRNTFDSVINENQKMLDILNPIMDEFSEIRDKINNEVYREASKFDEKINRLESITDKVEQQIESGEFGQSPAPFKNSWQHRAFVDAVQMAVEQGHTYLTWTTGKRSAEMARLDNTFESVEVRYTSKGYLKPDGSNKYAINAVGKDQFGENTIRKSLSEEELIELIGKDYAQEAITRLEKSDKPITSNKVELTDIVVPHKGRRLLYDSILPSIAKRIAKTLGTRPPTKAKIILQENAIVPEIGKKAGHKTQEVWVMELPTGKEKLHELQLYMPSMMPLQNIPVMPKSMKERQTMYFAKPQVRIAPSKASQARELEPENSYFKN